MLYVKSSNFTDVTYVHKPGQNKLRLWTYSIIFFESLDILTSLKSDMFNCVQSNTIMFLRVKKLQP